MSQVETTFSKPEPQEYAAIRAACGSAPISDELAARALGGTTAQVCIRYPQDGLIGFGRVVGDGALFFYLQDVLIHPDHQGEGLGEQIVTALMDEIAKIAPEGATIGLMSTPGNEGFYENYGFRTRPNDDHGAGMSQIVGAK
ncbi:MAG: GNAT family N-acetyltransferase [Paracoccus sp. (in: a-proteobacteria)]|uniref:GNAT family N-acetyltransferase n=1 Tax=Paracoccus sp. TaxID=267 RepID=UPI0026DFB267|nr:GNAT family N-acetyltransferase [Paracoccus sp. (in: a-proteobacteria)]MDO5613856.1 GNAT family N-acetyltransferase [Paracoccus sp. (in: a-proteobacteria)]MDO5630422.1 GNAT family N-acetyltransferase [Paracoccus sp. (in: a-proteobacteria)]